MVPGLNAMVGSNGRPPMLLDWTRWPPVVNHADGASRVVSSITWYAADSESPSKESAYSTSLGTGSTSPHPASHTCSPPPTPNVIGTGRQGPAGPGTKSTVKLPAGRPASVTPLPAAS